MRPSQTTSAVLAVSLVLSTLAATPSWAWGPHGHRIATRVAEARLNPGARRAVSELLLKGDTLVDVSTWADQDGHDAVPGSAPWHYVNVPITANRYEDRYCSKGNCVVAKIKHFRAVLADRSAPLRERRRALLFLIHFVEDVHQPLHVGDNHDRGGNLTQIQFLGNGTNLHRLWDSGLINEIDRNERVWVERIESQLTKENIRAWSRGSVEDWANESLQDAKSAYLFPAGARRPMESGKLLGKDYENFARPILERRLAQAGVRLANELNHIFE
ncbi:S1/P1 nuclease [Singulisphaera sp. Ch08]|uniref:S1/P1 nuclease n=1 Tax=Singulisphaera sp. Ch08 TaxID=3120278 RepID=A0AAU7CIM1_9BACT